VSGEDERRELILDAAGRTFGRYGYRKTTVGDIVREAGMARATVYKYFAAKDEMFRAVIDREVQDIVTTVRAAVEGEVTTLGRLRVAVVTHTAALREKVNVYRLTVEALPEVISRTHADSDRVVQEALNLYEWILAEGVKSAEIAVEDTRTTAWSILLAFKGVFISTVTGQMPELTPKVIDTLLDLLWTGLKPREEAA
jgi:AcrR family transcriptional regulator